VKKLSCKQPGGVCAVTYGEFACNVQGKGCRQMRHSPVRWTVLDLTTVPPLLKTHRRCKSVEHRFSVSAGSLVERPLKRSLLVPSV